MDCKEMSDFASELNKEEINSMIEEIKKDIRAGNDYSIQLRKWNPNIALWFRKNGYEVKYNKYTDCWTISGWA